MRKMFLLFAGLFVCGMACAQSSLSLTVEAVVGGSTKGYGPQYVAGSEVYGMLTMPWGLGVGVGVGLEQNNAVATVTNYDTRNFTGELMAPIFLRVQYDLGSHIYAAVNAGKAMCLNVSGPYKWDVEQWRQSSDGLFFEPQIGMPLGKHLRIALGGRIQRGTAGYEELGAAPGTMETGGWNDSQIYVEQRIGYSAQLHVGYRF